MKGAQNYTRYSGNDYQELVGWNRKLENSLYKTSFPLFKLWQRRNEVLELQLEH